LDNQSREQMLEKFGYILLRLQQLYTGQDSSKYHLIVRVLSEQYRIEGEQVRLREIREIIRVLCEGYRMAAQHAQPGGEKAGDGCDI